MTAEYQSRFRANIETILDVPLSEWDGQMGLAVSGGPDSLALMLLAHDVLPGKFIVATVDHQLRTEAAAEARYVAQICAERGLSCDILHPDSAITGNIQSQARAARYAALHRWADRRECAWIATAHHADDQLETILMRLARGSGVDGLSAVRTQNGRIIRPLLNFTKAELISICDAAGVSAIADPSNRNEDFDRVRIRQWLASMDHPLNPLAAANSAAALAEASAALDWTAQRLRETHISAQDGQIWLDPADLPPELLRRLLRIALQQLSPEFEPRGGAITRLLHSIKRGETASIGDILCKGGDKWLLRPAPPRGMQK
ncbi:tRNA lysidine(34) synthetase TilS [Sphingorhabdus arenilitoris]|uniref:tRNA(Ile)-lysidine synthase n=1 Tax=Sphingorhabdus arenilitoris TaxID=1490041 RepID=A0ABV8RLQ9_9SPHN